MTIDEAMTSIAVAPIHWHAGECTEVCTQVRDQLPSTSLVGAITAEKAGLATREQHEMVEAHQQALAAIMGTGATRSDYLIWATHVTVEIRRMLEAGLWEVQATEQLFSRR